MAEVEDINNPHQKFSTTPNQNHNRDLLHRFMASNSNNFRHHRLPLPPVINTEEEELELSLGLSMNGRFGVDPTAKKIKRTTSMIPELPNGLTVRDEEMVGGFVIPTAAAVVCSPLMRTCSLPTETEEEWRKRKELQTQRRMEARRKRNEKQRNLKAVRERNREEGAGLEDGGGGGGAGGGLRRTTSLTSRVGGLGLNGDKDKDKEKATVMLLPLSLPPASPPQGSIGSSSESECLQGQDSCTQVTNTSHFHLRLLDSTGITPMDTSSPERKSPVAARARVTQSSGKVAAAAATATATMRNLPSQHSAPQNSTKEIVRNILEDMPSVSTKGEGPNGKRIEGFLYRYGRGEEVRILCVCHGSFHTPAEFVKHAGGAEVANPLKHIVVSSSFV